MRAIILLLLILSFQISVYAQNKKIKGEKIFADRLRITFEKTPKGFSAFSQSAHILSEVVNDNFNFDSSHTGNYLYVHSTSYNSSIEVPIQEELVTVRSYIISNTEVTNRQYREFVNWVIDSIGLTVMASIDPSYYKDPTLKSLNWLRRHEVVAHLKDVYSPFAKVLDSVFTYSVDGMQIGRKYINTDKLFYSTRTGKETIAIYPDTLVWIRDIPTAYNDPISKDYFSSSFYNDYPVVGVNWYQAKAYCDWLSRTSVYEFRLPYLNEFTLVYSAYKHKKKNYLGSNHMLFPWRHNGVVDNSGKYLANFGELEDSYGFKIKSYQENIQKSGRRNDVYTTKVGSFPPTGYNIYDIAGNVSEWIEGGFAKEYSFVKGKIKDQDAKILQLSINENPNEIERKFNDLFKVNLTNTAMNETDMTAHNYLIDKLSKKISADFKYLSLLNEPRATIGGSFMDSPQFMRKGIIKAYAASETHSFIGFRVAADAVMRYK